MVMLQYLAPRVPGAKTGRSRKRLRGGEEEDSSSPGI